MNRKFVTFIGLALIAVLAVGQIFTASRGFSDMENRYLKAYPKAEAELIGSGEWMEQLETYLADHVPGRDEWVQIKNTAARLSGRRQIGQVVFTENDRLIQVQDVTLQQLQENAEMISKFAEAMPEEVEFDFLLAPNASWIYRDLLPKETLTYDPEEAAKSLQDGLSERVKLTVPYDTLVEHKEEAIYFKSDHHWTMRGAAYAYMDLAKVLGLGEKDPFAYGVTNTGHEFKGSIFSQAPIFGYEGEEFEIIQVEGLDAHWNSDTQTGPVLMKEKFEEKDQYTAFFGGNYGLVRIENEKASSEEKLLILKDSYANILVPFLIEDYSEIAMVDLRHYRGSVKTLVEAEGVNRVLAIYNLDFLCTDQSFAWLGV